VMVKEDWSVVRDGGEYYITSRPCPTTQLCMEMRPISTRTPHLDAIGYHGEC
jgi:hypothetical protein